MQIHRDSISIDPGARGAVAALGNFDGVHRGHQAILDLARRVSDAPLAVVTFEPHPREVFQPDAPPFRLMNAEARANRLARLGVDHLFELTFDEELAALSDTDFARGILSGRLGLSHVVVGEDFRFGKDRTGTAETLQHHGRDMGFGVTVAPMVGLGAERISSTAIREALSAGRPAEAARMLGHRHRLEGPVIRGDQRGRDLGYPTANISIDGLHPPRFGVYAVEAEVLDGPHAGTYAGAASIGIKPTFGENHPNCETFLFDFTGDLYGAHLSVALVDYLRPEERFDDLDALIAQMDADCARAREILA